ncbi:MAG TPA: hypothetical protein DC047_08450 [Blastocatellia bacterium]|nr:hypothetical protein [Blastocatellia bacterium]
MQRASLAHQDGPGESWAAPGFLLQRKCACGQHTIAGSSCAACGSESYRHSSGASNELRSLRESKSEPSQSRIPAPAAGEKVSVNGPSPGPGSASPPATANAKCPSDIKLIEVGQGNDRDFGLKGPITGWGGYGVMEVSDPSGRKWDGTKIHEVLANVKNTCDDPGTNACSNKNAGDDRAKSTFVVGQQYDFLGLGQLPAGANRFSDVHAFVDKRLSVLHKIDKQSCEVQCEQTYTCEGRRFGPDFLITYLMTAGSVPRSGGGFNAVTRVAITKTAKSTPAASPPKGSSETKP